MERQRALKLAAIVAGVALICLFFLVVLRRGPYRQGAASLDSKEVQQSLEILRKVAANPRSVAEFMSVDATKRARVAVAAAAVQMSRASSVEAKDADWFGEYLRVGVVCPTSEGKSLERYFFLKREDGELRITGLER